MAGKLAGGLLGGLVGGLISGLLGKKWTRKAAKLKAHDDAMQQLVNVGDKTDPLPLPSELQIDVPGKSGDAFAPHALVWIKTKQGAPRRENP